MMLKILPLMSCVVSLILFSSQSALAQLEIEIAPGSSPAETVWTFSGEIDMPVAASIFDGLAAGDTFRDLAGGTPFNINNISFGDSAPNNSTITGDVAIMSSAGASALIDGVYVDLDPGVDTHDLGLSVDGGSQFEWAIGDIVSWSGSFVLFGGDDGASPESYPSLPGIQGFNPGTYTSTTIFVDGEGFVEFTGLTISIVPEPSTWLLTLCGLGACLWLRRSL